jgi:hypothetical protein
MSALYVLVVLVVAAIVVFWAASRNRIGGEPRRPWFRRARPTSAPSDAVTDPFADDQPLHDSDPNLAALRANSNEAQNWPHHM